MKVKYVSNVRRNFLQKPAEQYSQCQISCLASKCPTGPGGMKFSKTNEKFINSDLAVS